MPISYQIRNFALFLFSFITLPNDHLYGQVPVVEWQKCYGGDNGDWARSIQQTSDGGYIVAGYSASGNTGDIMAHHGNASVGDIWVIKIDRRGNIEWQQNLGGTDSEDGAYILQTPDGGYTVAGSAASRNCSLTGNHGGLDFWVARLNSKGDLLWQKMYGGSQEDYATSISTTPDGGYLVAGHTFSNDGDVKGNHGGSDFWIIKIDETGNLVWQKCLGGSKNDQAKSVQSTADGGCVVAGSEESTDQDVTGNHGIGDCWLVKLDNSGKIQWQKTYGGTSLDEARCVKVTDDGGYVVAGTTGSYDGDVPVSRPGGYDTWVLKLDNAGNIQWSKCYGGTNNEAANYIQNTMDGGYVVAGYSSSSNIDLTCNAGNADAWAFKIDNAGNLQWQKSIGGNNYDEAYSIQPLSDGSFVVAGATSSADIAGYHQPPPISGDIGDYWVIKLTAPQNAAPTPTITFDPSTGMVCPNSLSTIKVSTNFAGLNPTYQWTRNGIAVGTNSPIYTASDFQNNDVLACTVFSGGPSCNNPGSQATQSLTLHANNLISPSVKIEADNTIVCSCTTINFSAVVTNGGTSPVFQWQLNQQNTGINAPLFSSSTLNPGDVITCIYSDNSGCITGGSVTSNSIKITDGTSSTASVNIVASPDTVCPGTTVTFNANPVNAGSNVVYQWKLNNKNTGSNSPTFATSMLSDGDQVSCILSLITPCSTTSTTSNIVTITVSSPLINITPLDTVINIGDQIQLNASITGSVSSFQWTPTDKLENSTALTPTTIHLMDNTTYTLTAVSSDGCVSSKSTIVKIGRTLYMPSAFTPNGDGKNDVFRIPPDALIKLDEFSIYDRWGNKIFSTKEAAKGWDGTINGMQQATGVYIYMIKGSNEKGKIFLKGSFTLIR